MPVGLVKVVVYLPIQFDVSRDVSRHVAVRASPFAAGHAQAGAKVG